MITSLENKNLYALDFNSKLEVEPGLKDVGKLKKLLAR
jgi:phosphoribosylanthranilate isomerase